MIILLDSVSEPCNLKRDEYYAIMVNGSQEVTSKQAKELSYIWNDTLQQWDAGIECSSQKQRFISKNFDSRNNPERGRTIIIKKEYGDNIIVIK